MRRGQDPIVLDDRTTAKVLPPLASIDRWLWWSNLWWLCGLWEGQPGGGGGRADGREGLRRCRPGCGAGNNWPGGGGGGMSDHWRKGTVWWREGGHWRHWRVGMGATDARWWPLRGAWSPGLDVGRKGWHGRRVSGCMVVGRMGGHWRGPVGDLLVVRQIIVVEELGQEGLCPDDTLEDILSLILANHHR